MPTPLRLALCGETLSRRRNSSRTIPADAPAPAALVREVLVPAAPVRAVPAALALAPAAPAPAALAAAVRCLRSWLARSSS